MSKPQKILVVGGLNICSILPENHNYTVIAVVNYEEAIKQLADKEEPFDHVITDAALDGTKTGIIPSLTNPFTLSQYPLIP